MTIVLQIRDYAVGLRVGLSFGRVQKEAPTPSPKQEAPAPVRKTPLGFQRNDPSPSEE
ncbi:hypothetical protein SEA_ADOLIN_70 [Arthrobacter phage Adolin]|uniref:Uncharacterized protein n=1 Tax=Arthrobacter phage Adolin TaxID=2686213 RepID=A0A6B9L5I2_9CAUD|nr:hypothetical protein SEA_ADOLIN_70 [Arthrobacter phage Adolin]